MNNDPYYVFFTSELNLHITIQIDFLIGELN